jgi:exopolysaccharide biosynthesis polyprenyl glycosylphosphotransferase
MGTVRREILASAVKLFDLLLLVVSFVLGTLPVLARVGTHSLEDFLAIKIKLENLVVFALLLWVWHLIFSMLRLYDSKRLASRRAELADVITATSLASLILLLASVFLKFQMVKPVFVLVFWVSSTLLIGGSRFLLRTVLRKLRMRGQNLRNMLIVGSNHRAIEFAHTIRSKPELGYRILGFADDEWAGSGEVARAGWSIISDFDSLRLFLRRNVVDEVVLALPFRSFHTYASDIAATCEQQGIIIRVLSNLFDLKDAQPMAEHLEGEAVITHHAGIADGWPLLIKRSMDFTLSLTLILILAPVLITAAIFIKLGSRGPVLFVQKRVGLNKRVFHIYKFRTMDVNAEQKLEELEHLNEVSGPVFKIKNDPRVTAVGRFLRKTSIDELPQLFNVLVGDMSLVGPRPLQLRDYELFTAEGADWQRRRFSVRPGITCLWQVNGRSSLPFEQWMELDHQYIQRWSLWLDCEILLKTIPAVLRGSGAA